MVGIPGGQAYTGFSEQIMGSGTIGSFGTLAGIYGKFDNNFLYADNLTWQRGRQVIKFGAEFLRYQQNNFDPGNDGTLGEMTYGGLFTGNPAKGQVTGYPFADFVLNYVTSKAVGGVRGYSGQRQWRDAYFVQDDWKLPNNVTLNLGARSSKAATAPPAAQVHPGIPRYLLRSRLTRRRLIALYVLHRDGFSIFGSRRAFDALEERNIAPSRYRHSQGIIFALIAIVGVELLSQAARMCANNIVVSRVVANRPAKNPLPDQMFIQFGLTPVEGLLHHMQQQTGKTR